MRKELLLLLLIMPMASAVQIEMVYYNPINESGSEFVLLYNAGEAAVNLTGWTIATPTSQQDATLIGVIEPNATYLLSDAGWEQGKDNSTWPQADHEEALTLPNTNGFVQLIDAFGVVQSTLGYGEVNVSEGTPHTGVVQGQALVRVNNTQNNQQDFAAQTPVFAQHFEEGESEQTTQVEVFVKSLASEILHIEVEDDNDAEGIQLIPIPGTERSISVNITVEDNNSLSQTTVLVNGEQLFVEDTSGTVGVYSGQIEIDTNTTALTITVGDDQQNITTVLDVELLSVIGIQIPDSVSLSMKPGQEKNTTITVQNTGNTNISLQIKGTQPTGIENILGTIEYALLGQRYVLEEGFLTHAVGLLPEQQLDMDLYITAGFVPTGTYTGQIILAGVAQ